METVAAIPQVLAGTGFQSLEEACPYLESAAGEGGASFAAMKGGATAASAFGFGVLKCIMEWCGYGVKKGDGLPIPNPHLPSSPRAASDGPKLPTFVDGLDRNGRKSKGSPGLDRIDEEDLPPEYSFEVSPYSPSDRPVFPKPSKPKYDYPSNPRDTSGEEVLGTVDLEEFRRRFPDE